MFVKNGNTVSTANAEALANALKSSHCLLQIDLVNAMLQRAGVPSFAHVAALTRLVTEWMQHC